jgi:hypothetical protein
MAPPLWICLGDELLLSPPQIFAFFKNFGLAEQIWCSVFGQLFMGNLEMYMATSGQYIQNKCNLVYFFFMEIKPTWRIGFNKKKLLWFGACIVFLTNCFGEPILLGFCEKNHINDGEIYPL